MKVIFKKLNDDVVIPKYKHTNDAGADILMYKDIVIKHGKNVINLGFKCIVPPGYAGFLSLRSSWMGSGLTCNFVPFDADYSGEWNLVVYNPNDDIVIHKGERICQLMIIPIVQAEFVDETFYNENKRGSNGMGSTGR